MTAVEEQSNKKSKWSESEAHVSLADGSASLRAAAFSKKTNGEVALPNRARAVSKAEWAAWPLLFITKINSRPYSGSRGSAGI